MWACSVVFWAVMVAGLVALPLIVSSLLEIKMVDRGKCTMAVDVCAKLTKGGTD